MIRPSKKIREYEAEGITSISDVEEFLTTIIQIEKINFHPDSKFSDYVNLGDGSPVFLPAEAEKLDRILARCFEVCGERYDLYEIALSILQSELKPPTRPRL